VSAEHIAPILECVYSTWRARAHRGVVLSVSVLESYEDRVLDGPASGERAPREGITPTNGPFDSPGGGALFYVQGNPWREAGPPNHRDDKVDLEGS
jgi:hypothetical protein